MKRVCCALLVLALIAGNGMAEEKKKFVVGVSIWTGWMPFYLMEEKGFLAKRAAEAGIEIELVKFKDYLASVQHFASGNSDGCAMTIMEAMQPAANGIDVRAIVVNDISNGGDGIVAKKGMTVKGMKGKEVLLEQFSVSHYLLIRALEMNGLTEGQVIVKNTPGDDAGKAFLTGNCDYAATWNPHLFLAEEQGKGEVIFTSKQIPGEIVDLLVWNGKKLDEDRRGAEAITLAWYDAMEMIENPDTRDEAIRIMATAAGATEDQFTKMLAGTDLYTSAAQCKEFLSSDTIQETEKSVKTFLIKHDQLSDDTVSLTYDTSLIPGE